MKFTPGPWIVEDYDGEYFPSVLFQGKSQCRIVINEGPSPEMVEKGDFIGMTMETCIANARLISQSPDMYQACCDALSLLSSQQGSDAAKLADRLREIIAKVDT